MLALIAKIAVVKGSLGSSMNILILNQHTNNFGDDAAGISLIYQIFDAFPDATIEIIYSWNEEKSSLPITNSKITHHFDLSVSLSINELLKVFIQVAGRRFSSGFLIKGNIGELARIVRRSDIVFISPCGANIGIYKDWLFLARIMISISEGITPIFHLNTIGRSNSFIFNLLARIALKRSKIFVREKASLDYLVKLGISSVRGVDTAFSLTDAPIGGYNIDLPKQYLIIIPTEFANWHILYRDSNIDTLIISSICSSIASFCKAKKLKIVLLPHLDGSFRENKLLRKYKDQLLSNNIDESDLLIAENTRNVYHYEQYIRSSEFVISMRYHGVIFAAKNSIPFLSLSYENKMKEACNYTGMSDYNIDINQIVSVDLLTYLEQIYVNKKLISAELTRRKPFLNFLARLPVHMAWLENNS